MEEGEDALFPAVQKVHAINSFVQHMEEENVAISHNVLKLLLEGHSAAPLTEVVKDAKSLIVLGVRNQALTFA